MKRSRLKPGSPPKRRKPLRKVNSRRSNKEWDLCFHSEAFVEWSHAQPCICRGKGAAWGCEGGPTVVSHDPSRGAGGTWKSTHPATNECHAKIGAGAETFWREIGRMREEANREHHGNWLAYVSSLEA